MKYRILTTILAISLLLGVGLLFAPEALAGPVDEALKGANDSGGSGGPTLGAIIQTVTNILLFIVGIAAVIMLIIGAIRYTTSAGDDSAAKSAKNTILYAIVGLILAFLAYAIVTFVINQFA